MPHLVLRALIEMADDVEPVAMQAENRVDGRALKKHSDEIERVCSHIRSDIIKLAKLNPLYEKLAAMTSPLTAARIIAEVDLDKAERVSSLWLYAGIGKRQDAERCNERLHRHMMGPVAECLLGGPYAEVYKRSFTYNCQQGVEEQCAASIARRDMLRVFCAHFWAFGRAHLGKPVTEPRKGEVFYDAAAFGWEEENANSAVGPVAESAAGKPGTGAGLG